MLKNDSERNALDALLMLSLLMLYLLLKINSLHAESQDNKPYKYGYIWFLTINY